MQDFAPVKSICAHLNAFHVYADDPTRFVEANHYCSHLTEGEFALLMADGHTASESNEVLTHQRCPPVSPVRLSWA